MGKDSVLLESGNNIANVLWGQIGKEAEGAVITEKPKSTLELYGVIEEAFKMGAIVKVTNKGDDYGKTGKIVTIGSGNKKDTYGVEFSDKQRGSFNGDEIENK